tara:strand:- start:151 stop:351 length:201 start_codon:yes stop_codon:yes gene_type:complete
MADSKKVQTTLSGDIYTRVNALASAKGMTDSMILREITQSWMVDNFDKEYKFWSAKVKEPKKIKAS